MIRRWLAIGLLMIDTLLVLYLGVYILLLGGISHMGEGHPLRGVVEAFVVAPVVGVTVWLIIGVIALTIGYGRWPDEIRFGRFIWRNRT
jgi:hypothetical protein